MVLFVNNCQNVYDSLTFQNNNFKVGGSARVLGGTGRKIGLNVENGNMNVFQVIPDPSEHSILHFF